VRRSAAAARARLPQSGDAAAPLLNLHAPGVGAQPCARLASGALRHVRSGSCLGRTASSVSAPGDGERLAKEHRLALVKAQHFDLDLLEYFVDGEYDGASRHVHLRHADCFHVLEGALEFRLDGETVRAEAGMSIVVPPGVPHEFTSAGSARFLNVHAPSFGFVEYLRKVDAGEIVDAAAHDVYDFPK
jgi:mannose-6-phosphate isomerase-like protein (cupin superfamily)